MTRGLRLSAAQEQALRRWPTERIRPKSVALGVLSLLAEVDALRAELEHERARTLALSDALAYVAREGCATVLTCAMPGCRQVRALLADHGPEDGG